MSSLPKCPSETDRSIKRQTVTFTTGAAPILLDIHTVLSHLYICIFLYMHLLDTKAYLSCDYAECTFLLTHLHLLLAVHLDLFEHQTWWKHNKTKHGFQTAFDLLKEKIALLLSCSAKLLYTKIWARRSYRNCPSKGRCPDFPLLLSCESKSRNPIKNVIDYRYIPWDRQQHPLLG